MTENTASIIPIPPVRVEKQIGSTTYIANASFNGNENRDLVKSIVRLIMRDSSKISTNEKVES